MSGTIVTIPVSPAELLDKITVLEIKEAKITDPAKLASVTHELALLREELSKIAAPPELAALHEALRKANEVIWDAEDLIREKWNDDAETLKQSRISHAGNDERFRLKREINALLGSAINEVKSHQK